MGLYLALAHSQTIRRLFTDRKENSVTNIAQARLEHSIRRQLGVNACYPDLNSFRPLVRGAAHTFGGSNDRQNDNLLNAPFS